MAGKIVGMVFDHYPGSGAEMLLAVKLADNAHEDGTSIYPSVETLARQTRQSVRTVQYQIRRMQLSGWLLLVAFEGGGRGQARNYRINPRWVRAHDSRLPQDERGTWDAQAEAARAHEAMVSARAVDKSVKGANSAPFMDGKRVQPDAQKGATAVARKGATAVAPEPHEPHRTNTPLPPRGGAATFDEFINAFPETRRIDVEQARQRVEALVSAGTVTLGQLVQAIKAQAALHAEAWRREQGKFAPKPNTWLRRERWLDPLPQAAPAAVLARPKLLTPEQLAANKAKADAAVGAARALLKRGGKMAQGVAA